MSSTQTILIAAAAGVAIVGAATWLKQDDLKAWVGGGGIHSVDFRNAPVEVVGTACADPQLITAGVTKVPLHDGTYQLGQYQFELVGDVRYGEVSGHTGESGSDKAVFVGSCSTAGKTSQVLFVYGLEDGKPARVASIDVSGVANTLVQSYAVGDGAIQIRANQGEPPTLVTLSYALLNGSLVNLNPAGATPTAQAPQTEQTAQMASATDASANDADAGEDKVSFESFHDKLTPYGEWMQHPRWGTVWHPTRVSSNFKPYRDGHWENTDEYGTVWVSDYSWGDVPFHYGRWGYDPNYGWLWQPGYVWSPAWVAWRQGAGNVGWFPIPPGYYDGAGVFAEDWAGWYGYRALYGVAFDEAAFYGLWSFVPADDIFAPSIGLDLIAPGAYSGFIGRTAGWTRFGKEHGHLVNRAIDGPRFRAAFGHGLPSSGRHDFLAHHGPIVGPDRGRKIAEHSHESVGVGRHVSASAHHAVAAHYGAGYSHHASTASHAYSRSGTFGHAYGSAYAHSPGTYSRAGGTYSHTGSTYSRTGQSGGYSRSGASARTGEESGFSRTPAQNGYAQRQGSFVGATAQQRPMNTGGFARPAPQVHATARSNTQHHR